MLQLFNTLTKKKEEFVPINTGEVLLYQCGPTVYWRQHIGNLRAAVITDFAVRSLRFNGLDVNFVRNYTDVGHLTDDGDEGADKMSEGAAREGVTPDQIAKKYIDMFESDCQELNITEPTAKPRATQYVEQMQSMIKVLLDKDYAYQTDLAIYFDISKATDYTKLSRQNLDENKEGAGKAEVMDPDKKNQHDFAIWFFKKGKHANALQTWESPWGEGFPGWHLECSVMCKDLLADTIDIHMGGIEHVSVHHTNEIAQSEAANGVSLAHYWLHYEHLLVDSKKMSKSEGTSYALSDITARGFDPLVLRYFFLQAHYRSKQNFTWEALNGASNAYKKLVSAVQEMGDSDATTVGADACKIYGKKFEKAINDDLNTPQALAIVWELIKDPKKKDDKKLATLLKFDEVLGLGLKDIVGKGEEIPSEIKKLAEKRQKAREEKDWRTADELRDKITERGYAVEDAEDGPVVKKLT